MVVALCPCRPAVPLPVLVATCLCHLAVPHLARLEVCVCLSDRVVLEHQVVMPLWPPVRRQARLCLVVACHLWRVMYRRRQLHRLVVMSWCRQAVWTALVVAARPQ